MSELPNAEEVERQKKKGRMLASLVREHYEALKESGFGDDEAFELAANYHWACLVGDGEDYE